MPAASQIAFINECHSEQQPKRAPRPPNAFMLYRSDFLKRRAIPPEVEKRQQNLSRIAGQCWNLLPEIEKAVWYGKAAVVRAEYLARHPSHETGPFHKETNRLSAKDKKRGSVSNPRRSFGRSRNRGTQAPYSCESMFTALHDPKSSSPAFQASLISPTPASESPLSTTASPSPLLLSHLLPSFALHTNSSSQDSPPVISKKSIRNEFGDPSESLGSEIPQGISHIIQDLKNVGILFLLRTQLTEIPFQAPLASEVSSSQGPYPTFQQYEDSFATCVPHPGLEQLRTLHSDPASQLPALSEANMFSPAGCYLTDCHSLANNFGVTDNLIHFNQSLVPLYP